MKNNSKLPRIAIIIAFFGLMNLLALISSPAWENLRGVDIVRLLGTGMCFGAALVSFGIYYKNRN